MKAIVLAVFVLVGAAAVAQDRPMTDLYAGYAYTRAETEANNLDVNLHGFEVAITPKFNEWLGVTVDFGGGYTDTDTQVYTLMAGPQVSFGGADMRVKPYGHALFGAARGYIQRGRGDWGFAMALGGGVDWKAENRIALRLVQADYLYTRLQPAIISLDDQQNNLRLSTGVVFRW